MVLADFLRHAVNWLSEPSRFFLLTTVAFVLLLFPGEMGPQWLRSATRPLVAVYRPRVAAVLFAALGGLFAIACLDPNFQKIVLKPDNVPIAGMIFLVLFFVWFALQQARDNDRRSAEGRAFIEKEEAGDPKVMVWPDLVYTEFICKIVGTHV